MRAPWDRVKSDSLGLRGLGPNAAIASPTVPQDAIFQGEWYPTLQASEALYRPLGLRGSASGAAAPVFPVCCSHDRLNDVRKRQSTRMLKAIFP